jgi:uncharacterized protein YndB with AHSA1/START domain
MLERQVVIPASPDQLWDALTDPESVSAWFGAQVDWDVQPGGAARFLDDDGTFRRGVIDAVMPGRHLSFRWWRDGDPDNGASQVTYQLEPDGDGTRLTVIEQQVADLDVDAATADGVAGTPTTASTARADTVGAARASSAGSAPTSAAAPTAGHGIGGGGWTAWDSRIFECWAHTAQPALVGRATS